MNGIVINIDPVAFHLGPLQMHWYGLMIAVAIIVGVLITVRVAEKKAIAADHIYNLVLCAVLGGIVGARLFHVVDYWEFYMADPTQILRGTGLALYGALAGGIAASGVYARIRHLPPGRVADSLAPGLLVALMIGRIGCIINGDSHGVVTDLPWAFIYTHPGAMLPRELLGQPTHPYPAYEIIWNAMALLVIWRLDRRFKKEWMVFLSFLSLYSAGRFILMFVRDQRVWLWGLQQAQIIALLVLVVSLGLIIYSVSKRPSDGYRDP